MFKAAAWLIDTFYGWVNNYAIAISLVAVAIMILITPLTMKSTKGMLEMQRLQPEMKKLQNQYKGDR
ncbi:MAG: YidC/Oxa1 family membrane protein insertase, partial [Acidimicrobiaceae bacterium]